ncbi:MAG: glycoside hydrolase family 13 protein [Sphingobacteriia bacterium]|nr:glycoside hydrolase family 13 protein [Sphingobacteriia bacterium]
MKRLYSPILSLVALLFLFGCAGSSSTKTNITDPPKWASEVVWYQIFVERFSNGDTTNDPTPETISVSTSSFPVPPDWKITPWSQDWYEQEAWAQKSGKPFRETLQHRRYGGDLQGVLNKLDYLKDLGITAIYFNPLNDAPSLHKYDARNYHHIDVNFGPDPKGDIELMKTENPSDPSTWKWTSADKLFLKVVEEAHKRGMKVILDYSWNHTGVQFWAMQDIMKNGEKSAYKDWYEIVSFDDPKTLENEFQYKGWLNVQSLPELRKVDLKQERVNGMPFEGNVAPGPKQHIFDVTKRWLAPDGDTAKGINGYRLDVADQIPMGFWRDYRSFVKSVKPDAYLVGEIWWEKWPNRLMNPVPYNSGDAFDAVMFYQIYRPARDFFTGVNPGVSATELIDSLNFQWNRLSVPYRYGQMNVNATHDSPRLLTCFANPGKYKYHANPAEDPNYITGFPSEETYKRVRLYLIHQFTIPGSPSIWNGDELGMTGADDPDCRKPIWWPEMKFNDENRRNIQTGPKEYERIGANLDHLAFYKSIISLRNHNKVLMDGEVEFLASKGKLLAYERKNNDDKLIVILNADTIDGEFALESGSYVDLLSGKEVSGGKLVVPSLTGFVLRHK